MKSFIFFNYIFLIMLQVAAQPKTVNIHGIVKDTSVKNIELSFPMDANLSNFEHKNLNVVNGTFSTSIQIPFPSEVVISYGNMGFFKNFIYSDAKILIDSTGTPDIIGSPIQDEYENYFLPLFHSNDKLFDSIQTFYRRNYQKYNDEFPQSIKDSAIFFREKFCSQRAELLSEYIKQHPNSYVALWDIYYYVSMGILNQYFNFEKLLSTFSNEMQQVSFVDFLKGKVKGSDALQVGQIFPEEFFKGNEQMQNKIQKNCKYYLIDFWYSHCGPCIAGFPKLKDIYNQFHNKGFDIVSISVDQQKSKMDYLAAIKKNKLVWNQVWDKDGVASAKYNINVFPTYILLDKNGRVINFDIQANELEEFLKKNLGK